MFKLACIFGLIAAASAAFVPAAPVVAAAPAVAAVPAPVVTARSSQVIARNYNALAAAPVAYAASTPITYPAPAAFAAHTPLAYAAPAIPAVQPALAYSAYGAPLVAPFGYPAAAPLVFKK